MQTTIGEGTGWTQTLVAAPSSETVFSIPFPFFGLDDVEAHLTQAGATTVLIRGSDFDIAAIANDDGIFPMGTLTLRAAVTDCTMTLIRMTAIERTSNFPLTGYFDRNALNQQLNRLAAIEQEFRRDAALGIRLREEDLAAGDFMVLPPFSQAPGMALLFDATGQAYFGTQVDLGGTTVSGFGLELVQSADADAALALLGFSPFFQTLIGATDANALRALLGIPNPTPIPVGAIVEYGGGVEPANFLICDGRLLDRVAYSTLFAVIGTLHGAGDGATTFAIPDRRGTYGAGKDDMGTTGVAARITWPVSGVAGNVQGSMGGSQQLSIAVANLPAHSHAVPSSLQNGGDLAGGTGAYTSRTLANNGVSGTIGGGQALGHLPPTYINLYVIKVQ